MTLSKYEGKNVQVVDNDGKVYKGKVDLYTPAHDNDGQEAIALDSGYWLDADDIKTIMEI